MPKLERGLAAGVDPLGWDALADCCEERGDPAAAELWRRRAACLRAVLRLRELAPYAAGQWPHQVQFALADGWVVLAYGTRKEVRASLVRDKPPTAAIGWYYLSRASLLGQTQGSPEAATLYLRRKAFQWAEVIA